MQLEGNKTLCLIYFSLKALTHRLRCCQWEKEKVYILDIILNKISKQLVTIKRPYHNWLM